MAFLESARKQFAYYRMLGERAMAQIAEEDFHRLLSPESNSVAIIVKHLHGNMLSRWTNFLHEDGEKSWRDREAEFDNDLPNRAAIIKAWDEGWDCLFAAIDPLTESDLDQLVYIRNQGHSIVEAINRQMSHYAYHTGQIVFLCRLFAGANWQSLSIPKGGSRAYNAQKFEQPKERGHFTDEFLSPES